MDITASEAMTLLVKARIDGIEKRHTLKYFAGAYKDGLCFAGLLDAVAAGTHIIDVTVTPTTGTATIDQNEYNLMITADNIASSEVATPYPVWENYPMSPELRSDFPYQVVIHVDNSVGANQIIHYQPGRYADMQTIFVQMGWPVLQDYDLLIASKEKLWIESDAAGEEIQSGLSARVGRVQYKLYRLSATGIWTPYTYTLDQNFPPAPATLTTIGDRQYVNQCIALCENGYIRLIGTIRRNTLYKRTRKFVSN